MEANPNDVAMVINTTYGILAFIVVILFFRGVGQLFDRYGTVPALFYCVFIFFIAVPHAAILGVFGKSKKKREQEAMAKKIEEMKEIQKALKEDEQVEVIN